MGQNQPPNQWVMNCNYEKGKDCTVSAMIDGGPNNLLGTFLIVSYSVAYTTLTIVADGVGRSASMQVDNWPFVSTNICTGGACSYDRASRPSCCRPCSRARRSPSSSRPRPTAWPARSRNTLQGFAAQYDRAVEAQQGR